MVKRGGTKRKATMQKIPNKGSIATTFTKRTYGLFSKVSQLCLLSDAQIAVLLTPPSSNSNVHFYSFGHSSVDSVVDAYLKGDRPVRQQTTREDDEDIAICMARKELGLDLWWEDPRLLQSAANPDELIHKISRMFLKIKEFRSQDRHDEPLKNNYETMKQTESADPTLILPSDSNLKNMNGEQDKTLNFQYNSQVCCNPILLDDNDDDDFLPADYKNVLTEEQDQIMAACNRFRAPENNYNNNVITGEQDQMMGVCDTSSVPEIDLDKFIDFDFDITRDCNPILLDENDDDDDDFLPADDNNVMNE